MCQSPVSLTQCFRLGTFLVFLVLCFIFVSQWSFWFLLFCLYFAPWLCSWWFSSSYVSSYFDCFLVFVPAVQFYFPLSRFHWFFFFCCCVSFPVSLVYVAQSGLCSVSLHHYPSHHASGSWFSWTSWVFVPLGFSFLVHYFHRLSLKVRFEFSSLLGPQPHATEPDGKKNGPLQLL